MAENRTQFQCTGNCLNCIPQQRTYCAAQHSFSNMKVLDRMMEEIIGIKDSIATMKADAKEMTARIEAMQNSEAYIFDPNREYEESPEPLPHVSESDETRDEKEEE